MKYTFRQFQADFPNDDACLDRILLLRYGGNPTCPKCERETKYHRIEGRRQYACQWCGHHVAPCAGTIFEKSSTDLSLWFHAMYLMTATRNGVSGKELERQLGVTYKCAWRIGHQIRKLMAQRNAKNGPLFGTIEVDETYVGGKKGKHVGLHMKEKAIVMGMLQRGGKLKAKVVPNVKSKTLRPLIQENVHKWSTIHSDELRSYKKLADMGYNHYSVMHSMHQYVDGDCHVNSLEGFWSHLKRGISSTHVFCKPKYLDLYVGEFAYRYNNRKNPATMFYRMLCHLARPVPTDR